MSSKKGLLRTDLVVRFDPATRSISFHTVSPVSGEPMANSFHEVEWPKGARLTKVIDVGSAVCANLFATHPSAFCSEDD